MAEGYNEGIALNLKMDFYGGAEPPPHIRRQSRRPTDSQVAPRLFVNDPGADLLTVQGKALLIIAALYHERSLWRDDL